MSDGVEINVSEKNSSVKVSEEKTTVDVLENQTSVNLSDSTVEVNIAPRQTTLDISKKITEVSINPTNTTIEVRGISIATSSADAISVNHSGESWLTSPSLQGSIDQLAENPWRFRAGGANDTLGPRDRFYFNTSNGVTTSLLTGAQTGINIELTPLFEGAVSFCSNVLAHQTFSVQYNKYGQIEATNVKDIEISQSQVTDLSTKLTSMSSRIVAAQEAAGSNLEGRVDSLSSSLATTASSLNTRIDTVSSSLVTTASSLNSRVDTVSSQIASSVSSLSVRISDNERVGSSNCSAITTIQSRITAKSAEIVAANARIDSLSSSTSADVSALNTRVDTVSSELVSSVSSLNTRIDSVSAVAAEKLIRVNSLSSTLSATTLSLNTRIDTVSSELVSSVSSLNARIDTNSSTLSTTNSRLISVCSLALNSIQKTGNQIISADLTVNGDLIVTGCSSLLRSTIVEIEDNTIVLNKPDYGDYTANTSGIEIHRGSSLTNATFTFDSTLSTWTASHYMQLNKVLDSDGSEGSTDQFLSRSSDGTTKWASVVTDLSSVNSRIDTISSGLSAEIAARVSLSSKHNALRLTVSAVSAARLELHHAHLGLVNRVDDIEEDVSAHEVARLSSVSSLNTRIDTVSAAVVSSGSRIDSISTAVVSNTVNITANAARIDSISTAVVSNTANIAAVTNCSDNTALVANTTLACVNNTATIANQAHTKSLSHSAQLVTNSALIAAKANKAGDTFTGSVYIASGLAAKRLTIADNQGVYVEHPLDVTGKANISKGLSVGTSNTIIGASSALFGDSNYVGGGTCFVQGNNNNVNGTRNVAFGNNITIGSLQAYNFVVGDSQTLDPLNVNQGNAVFGEHNHLKGVKMNFVAGGRNIISSALQPQTTSYYNFIAGQKNVGNSVQSSMISGDTNSALEVSRVVVAGDSNTVSSVRNTFITGKSNYVRQTDNALVAGLDNDLNTACQSAAIGQLNTITGNWSVVGGYQNSVSAQNSVVMGQENNVAGGFHTVAGYSNIAKAEFSLVAGTFNQSNEDSNIVAGSNNQANGRHCLAVGFQNIVGTSNDWYSVATGFKTRALGTASFAGGIENDSALKTQALAKASFVYGKGAIAYENAENSAVFGANSQCGSSQAAGDTAAQALAFGFGTKAQNDNSLAGGNGTITEGDASFAMGFESRTHGNADYSLALGYQCQTGEVNPGVISAKHSVAIGFKCRAYKDNSFAGGNETFTFGDTSFAFGNGAVASAGFSNIALGQGITTPTDGSSADGDGQVAVGRFNEHAYTGTVAQNFAVGTGTADGSRFTSMYVGPRSAANANIVLKALQQSAEYANDSAAATGGVPVGGLYRTGSTVKIRMS